jgi:hypothetical protein
VDQLLIGAGQRGNTWGRCRGWQRKALVLVLEEAKVAVDLL